MALTANQAVIEDDFQQRGYAGPYPLVAPTEAESLGQLVRQEFENNRFRPLRAGRNRHLDLKSIAKLCRLTQLTDAATAVLGPDLILWRTQMFFQVRERALPWHQDLFNNLLDNARINISIHIALTAATEQNCMTVIPGSHRADCGTFGLQREDGPSPNTYGNQRFTQNGTEPPENKMILAPGEFFIFDSGLIHRTGCTANSGPRLAFVMRITTPAVTVRPEAFSEIPKAGHTAVLLSGRDSYRLNQLGSMPE
jgi:ectoine hydroxylase-related dioxygenase (phytanoyl-CoA dioxygenase family)